MLTDLTMCQVRTSSSTEPPSASTWKTVNAPDRAQRHGERDDRRGQRGQHAEVRRGAEQVGTDPQHK